MYKDILIGIAGIDVFPVISLVLFVVVFSVVVIRVARMDRGYAQQLAHLPLEALEGSDLECGCFSSSRCQSRPPCSGTERRKNTHIPDLTREAVQ